MKILEVHYNWVADKEAIPGYVYEKYELGQYHEIKTIDGQGWENAKCDQIDISHKDGFHVVAKFGNGVTEEQWNINKIIYTSEL